MLVDLKVKHFKNSVFDDIEDCPLARAINEITGCESEVFLDRIFVIKDGKDVATFEIINEYLLKDYRRDKFKSLFYWNPEKVIRTVPIKEIR